MNRFNPSIMLVFALILTFELFKTACVKLIPYTFSWSNSRNNGEILEPAAAPEGNNVTFI